METVESIPVTCEPWNKGKLVGQKTPFKLKEIWAIRVRFIYSVGGGRGLLDEILLRMSSKN
jgi:hypothetical protein